MFFLITQELILGGLKAETLYSVSVAAYTTKGDGAHSKAKLVQTLGTGKWTPIARQLQFNAVVLVTRSDIDLTVKLHKEQK